MRKIILFSCIILLLLVGCSKESKKEETDILKRTLSDESTIVVDVRTKEEYDTGHVKDSINIPYDEIDESINLDKNKIILVYCRSGKRSHIAYETLTNLGYEVIDLGAYDSVTLEKE